MQGFWVFTRKLLKRYGKGGFLLLLLQVITVCVQLVVMPFLTRFLSQSDFGIFQFSQSLINWFAIFSVGNSTLGSKKGMVEGKNGTIWYSFLYRIKFFIVLSLLCFVVAAVLYFLNSFVMSALWGIVGLFLLIGYLPQVSYPQVFFAKNDFGLLVFWQSLAIILSQGLCLVAAFLTHNVIIVTGIQYLSFALLCSIAFVHALKKYNCVAAYKKGEIDRDCIDYGKKLIPVEIVQGTAGTIHNFIVGPVFGFATLATFSVATRIDVLFRSCVSSGYYLLYNDFVKTEHEVLKKHIKKNILFIFFSSSLIAVILFFVSTFYIQKFLPLSYQHAIVYTGILICGLPALVLQSIIQGIFESKLKSESIRLATYTSQILRILLLVFGGFFGVLGITLSLSLSAWVSLICFVCILFEINLFKKFLPLK